MCQFVALPAPSKPQTRRVVIVLILVIVLTIAVKGWTPPELLRLAALLADIGR